MPCIQTSTPTLSIEIRIDKEEHVSFIKLPSGGKLEEPLVNSSTTFDKQIDRHIVSPSGEIDLKNHQNCINILFILRKTTPYQFDIDHPFDFIHTNLANSIAHSKCSAHSDPKYPGTIQVETPTVGFWKGRFALLSLTYHNHTMIADYTMSIGNHIYKKIPTNDSYYRIRLIPAGGGLPICSVDPILHNGDHVNPADDVIEFQTPAPRFIENLGTTF